MKAYVFLILAILLTPPFFSIAKSVSETISYSHIDEYVLSLSDYPFADIYEIADSLARFDSKHARFRAAFRWVTDNISYDCIDFHKKEKMKKSQSYEKTLEDRSAVCGGYANLLKALCDRLNVECIVINGYSKTSLGDIGQKELSIDHAWNAVQLDGKWHLVDVTWASGYTDRKTRHFTKRYTPKWFFTNPEIFVLTHLPEDPQWQLLEAPQSLLKFSYQPLIHTNLSYQTFDEILPRNGKITSFSHKNFRFQMIMRDGNIPMGHLEYAKLTDYRQANGQFTPENSHKEYVDFDNKPNRPELFWYQLQIKEKGTYVLRIRLDSSERFYYLVEIK
ncbi:MAG: transglutaminase domain-containing protein [Bacteroidota bacterium]